MHFKAKKNNSIKESDAELATSNPVQDELGRSFKTLRLSLTPLCNFSCTYCVPENSSNSKVSLNQKAKIIPTSQYIDMVLRLHKANPLETVRLTGGEPLLYKELVLLVRKLKEAGINKVKMTTNAYLLSGMAEELKDAGLDSINVSFDAIDEAVFEKTTRHKGYKQVLAGIDAAINAGIEIKLNATITKGLNDTEIIPLLSFAIRNKVTIRYLELMRMGHLTETHRTQFYSQKEMLAQIEKHHTIEKLPRKKGSTAKYWQVKGTLFRFGIIANHSDSFCNDCNRLRMDAEGKMFGCLSKAVGYNFPDLSSGEEELHSTLTKSLKLKQETFQGSSISMKMIGG